MKNLKLIRAFTLWELQIVVVIVVMGVMATISIPWLTKDKRLNQRLDCVNNLKEVGLAFRVWEGDNADKYPMAVSTASGGALENVWSLQNMFAGSTVGVTNVFMCMSNELSTPKMLACPADAGKTALSYWTNATFSANISYFVCGDAAESYPRMILSGDRNVGTLATIGQNPAVTTNISASWATATQLNWLRTAWTATDLHQKVGNLGFADGSVGQVTISGLQTALQAATNAGSATVPAYNFPNGSF